MKTILNNQNLSISVRHILLCIALASGMASMQAATVYDSGGFETFVPAQPLDTQDLLSGPWAQDNGASTAEVTAANPIEGNQSVKITRAAGGTGDTRWGVVKSITPAGINNVVNIHFDMRAVRQANEFGPLFGIEAYDASAGAPKLIGSLLLDASTGQVMCHAANTGAFVGTGTYLDVILHHHYQLQINFTDKTCSLYADDSLIHTEGFVDAAATNFTDAPLATLALDTASNTNGIAYFDNYAINTTTTQTPYLTWVGDGTANVWDAGVSSNWFDGVSPVVFTNGARVVFDDSGSVTPAIDLQGSLLPSSVTVSADQDFSFSGTGSLDGASGLVKEGAGTLTLFNASSYTGETEVYKGTLSIRNASGNAIGTNRVSVYPPSTISGDGTIGGSLWVAQGGVVKPGVAGPGSLAIADQLVLDDASLKFDLGTSSDQLVAGGDLTLGGTLEITNSGGFGPGSYTLITYGGALTAGTLLVTEAPDGYDYTVSTNTPGQINLIVALPPPPPVAPGGLVATTISSSQIDLVWLDNSTNETGFQIERSQNNVNFIQIATTGADVTGYSDMGLYSGTTYYYRVRASNAGGESLYSNVADATTTPAEAVAWYEFEGNANDSSGNAFHGTAVGVQYSGGKSGAQSALFDGTTSFVDIPAMIGTNFTVSMWLKTTDTGGTDNSWTTGKGLVDGEAAAAGGPLRPVEDGSVQEASPNATRGGDTLLAMSGSGQQNVAYLRFDLSGFNTVAPGAALTVYNSTASMTWSATQVEIYGLLNTAGNTAQNWIENGLTYNTTGLEIPGDGSPGTQDLDLGRGVFLGNLPTLLSTAVSVPIAFTSTNFDSFLASRVADGGQVTLLIVNRANAGRNLIYHSKETGDGSTYTGPSLAISGTPLPEVGWGTAVLDSKFALGIGDPNTTLSTSAGINDGAWHHLTATRDSASGEVKLYVDGVLNVVSVGPTGPRTAATRLHIGNSQSSSASGFLNGSIDDLKIYDRVLNPFEVAALAATTFAQWQLDYFGCTNCPPADPNADPDGDGMKNSDEYAAGTSPTNSLSAFKITSMTVQGSDAGLAWTTVGGRTNIVQSVAGDSHAGIRPAFIDVSGPIVISGSGDTTTNFTDVGAADGVSRYYRIRQLK